MIPTEARQGVGPRTCGRPPSTRTTSLSAGAIHNTGKGLTGHEKSSNHAIDRCGSGTRGHDPRHTRWRPTPADVTPTPTAATTEGPQYCVSEDLLMTWSEHADYGGNSTYVFGREGPCDGSGYRLFPDDYWGHVISSAGGTDHCNAATFHNQAGPTPRRAPCRSPPAAIHR